MFDQMRPDAEQRWADAALSIPGVYYWTSGQAPAEARWDPFDRSCGLLRAAPEPLRSFDSTYVDEAVANFTRTGFRGGLGYYRSIDPFFAVASRAYAGAVIRQPSFFLTGARDGLNRVRQPSEASLRPALAELRGFVTIEDAGHWPQLETPEQVNAALLSFLTGL